MSSRVPCTRASLLPEGALRGRVTGPRVGRRAHVKDGETQGAPGEGAPGEGAPGQRAPAGASVSDFTQHCA